MLLDRRCLPLIVGLALAGPLAAGEPREVDVASVVVNLIAEVEVAAEEAGPLVDLAVPAGKHTLILLNSSAGIKEKQKITLSKGQVWTKSFQFSPAPAAAPAAATLRARP